MTTTELKIGLTNSVRPSSRVLKPPGGGHSNIFAEPDVAVNAPRPKYNQQNSSNLNACMGSTDANLIVEKLREEITCTKPTGEASTNAEAVTPVDTKVAVAKESSSSANTNGNGDQSSRGRVPPGGYSSGGFW